LEYEIHQHAAGVTAEEGGSSLAEDQLLADEKQILTDYEG